MLKTPRSRIYNLGFLIVLVIYLMTASAYALWTPAWENPDEPAHYNYVRYILDNGRLPVLQMGDYPGDYLEQIKAAKFPPDMSIDGIRYESHQPPLYYLVAVPVLALVNAQAPGVQVLALRLLSVLFGAATLCISYLLFARLFPGRKGLALLATAFMATIPMHIAVTASVNNDAVANLLLLCAVALLLKAVREHKRKSPRVLAWWALAGVATGLGMLTKTTAYAAVAVGGAVLIWYAVKGWLPARRAVAYGAVWLGPALALNLPWYIRNGLVYGGTDILGLQRHAQVAAEQATTAQWVSQMGWGGLAQAFGTTTFRSFWGQFGWMGVLIDQRIYQALALFGSLLLLGLLLYALRASVNPYISSPSEWKALSVFGLWFLSTGVLYVWYNMQFVQHQGRYLFPALPALGLGMALGFQETLRPSRARFIVLVSALAIGVSLGLILITGRAFKTLTLLLGLMAFVYIAIWRLGQRASWVWPTAAYIALVGLDVICLFQFIVPYFAA